MRGHAVKPIVGNFGHADVGFARVGIARSDRLALVKCEKGCLAYLGQADDASFHMEEKMITGGRRMNRALRIYGLAGVNVCLLNRELDSAAIR